MPDFRQNHFVPKWYQERFIPSDGRERKFYYLDLKPGKVVKGTKNVRRRALLRWGPKQCFVEQDLYTTKFGEWVSTEIEQMLFGRVDSVGRDAVKFFDNFQHPDVSHAAFDGLLEYMSIQKLRTPKGLAYLASLFKLNDKNQVLFELQRLQHMHCTLWSECVWSLVDSAESETKFIVSDHPVTVYNKGCFPSSSHCRGYRDPDIALTGTHTLFPLSLNRLLVLTNLSWMRNPYTSPRRVRPNPQLYRRTFFNFHEILSGRSMSEREVLAVNFILKRRAYRFIAAAEEHWLYPEHEITDQNWNRLGDGYLLMPDPRSAGFGGTVTMKYTDGHIDNFDEYGRVPGQEGFDDQEGRDQDLETYLAFQGEYARIFGPHRRGLSYMAEGREKLEDDPDYHKYHLQLESKFKGKLGSRETSTGKNNSRKLRRKKRRSGKSKK